jgi:hypothetical protein
MKLNTAFVVVSSFLVVVCLVVSGCKSAPPAATIVEKNDSTFSKQDSTWTTERIVHDTITTPGEIIIIERLIECDSVTNKPKEFKDKVKGSNSSLEISLKDGLLRVRAKYDSLLHVIDLKEKHINTLTKSLIEVNNQKRETKIITEYKTHRYDIACRWMALILIILTIYKIKKHFYE